MTSWAFLEFKHRASYDSLCVVGCHLGHFLFIRPEPKPNGVANGRSPPSYPASQPRGFEFFSEEDFDSLGPNQILNCH